MGLAEYTKKGIVCQEGKTTREKTRRYEEKVQADIADNDYRMKSRMMAEISQLKRKEEWRKRDCFFHPQLNTNPIMEGDLGAGNRNKALIEGLLQG